MLENNADSFACTDLNPGDVLGTSFNFEVKPLLPGETHPSRMPCVAVSWKRSARDHPRVSLNIADTAPFSQSEHFSRTNDNPSTLPTHSTVPSSTARQSPPALTHDPKRANIPSVHIVEPNFPTSPPRNPNRFGGSTELLRLRWSKEDHLPRTRSRRGNDNLSADSAAHGRRVCDSQIQGFRGRTSLAESTTRSRWSTDTSATAENEGARC